MDRSWMYTTGRSRIRQEFFDGVQGFIDFAISHTTESVIRCPCRDCVNGQYHSPDEVKRHLYLRGFTPNYNRWICHGEPYVNTSNPSSIPTTSQRCQNSPMRGEYWEESNNLSPGQCQESDLPSSSNVNNDAELPPSPRNADGQPEMIPDPMDEFIHSSKKYWNVLQAADQPLWAGCEGETQLSSVVELLKIKSEFNLSENCYNKICRWVGKCLPRDHIFPSDYYHTKKLVRELGMPLEKIDICPQGCMLYWKEDINLRCCKFCNKDRYKRSPGGKDVSYKQLRYLPIIPRLQRLYASNTTAKHMRWHAEHEAEDGIMCHPSDSEDWKQLDRKHPEFAAETRNVRLALCSDGFAPFGQTGTAYSCWPIIITPYNLPPSMCLKTPYMFLSAIIPGPRNPKKLIDICLQPLIDELKLLWSQGVPTFDISCGKSFTMRAALLWTINDFPAYGMLSGWSTAGRMACPICMDDTNTFWLKHSRKHTWFDCHRRFLPHDHAYRKKKKAFFKGRVETSSAPERLSGQAIWNRVKDMPTAVENPHSKIPGYKTLHKWTKQSIFWQLPYWSTLMIRHNFDVMHMEKNVFDNFFNTLMDILGKSKDTLNVRKDMNSSCDRPELQVDDNHTGPKPKAIYTMAKIGRKEICEWIKSLKFPDGYASNLGRCVQMDECKLIGMKSHDCHVFMQRLFPIAFREMLPVSVWGPLTELSQFFHSLCSPSLSVAQMQEMEHAIPLILCKLEMIFPPSVFDSMEHLLIHLPFEAINGGPVQYRWMYPFERFLFHLKHKVANKRHVEASICNSYIIEEIAILAEHYFVSETSSRRKQPRQANEVSDESPPPFSIFNYRGEGFGKTTTRWLTEKKTEMHAIESYILLNCPEVEPYAEIFDNEIGGADDESFDVDFNPWFKSHVYTNNVNDDLIKSLSHGPKAKALIWQGYKINGYKFNSIQRGEGKFAMNSGVWVKGSNYNDDEDDYYGLIEEIIQLDYPGTRPKVVVIFKCRWFDPRTGVRKHRKYDIVDVNPKRIYRTNGPFILAQQAIQVFYAPYPGAKGERADWQAVCKTKARSMIEQKWVDNEEAYQPEEVVNVPTIDEVIIENLRDPSGDYVHGAAGEEDIIASSSSDEGEMHQNENSDEEIDEEEDDF